MEPVNEYMAILYCTLILLLLGLLFRFTKWAVQKRYTASLERFYNLVKRKVGYEVSKDWSETNVTLKWLLYNRFWPLFCHIYVHLSQNWGSEGQFEMPNRSKSQFVQKLWHKIQIFPFSFFCDFVKKSPIACYAFLFILLFVL